MSVKDIAVVVTFNKLELLKKCLEAIKSQSKSVDKVIVVNNNSKSDTKEYLATLDSAFYVVKNLNKNIGGAGGFNIGIKEAMTLNPSGGVWIMDDDTIPNSTAFEKIDNTREFLKNQFGFICSNVRWTDGKPCIMNVPTVSKTWNEFSNDRIIGVDQASFVSIFVNAEAIKKVGYPISDFFIWGDDMEYTERISAISNGYMACDSYVIHEMKENTGVDLIDEGPDRIGRHFFDIRNKFFRAKQSGGISVIKYLGSTLVLELRILRRSSNKLKKISVVNKGFFQGIFFNPKIEKYSK